MGRARDAIASGTFPDLLRTFFRRYFTPREVPNTRTSRSKSKERKEWVGDCASRHADGEVQAKTSAGTVERKPKGPMYPKWCVDALRSVGVDLLEGDPDAGIVEGSGANWEYANTPA